MILMTIRSILKTIGRIGREILSALYDGLARLGCGMAGIYYEG